MLIGCKPEKAPPAAQPPLVTVAIVEQRDVPIFGEWIGRLDGSANVDIRARVQGYVQEIAFNEGTLVKEGDLLVRIDLRPYEAALAQANAELAQAIASQEKADQEEKRQTNFSTRKSQVNKITTTQCRLIWRRKRPWRLPAQRWTRQG